MNEAYAKPIAQAPSPIGSGTAQLAQFFIPASASLQERRPRTLKHDDTFGVFDHNGDALSGPGSPEGIFYRDTRYLSLLYLTIGGARPLLLSSTLRDDNAVLTCDLTNPDLFDEQGQLALEHDLIHIRRTRFLWNMTCHDQFHVRNFDKVRRTIRIDLAFAADFADLFEVRGAQRQQRGTFHPVVIREDGVTLAYTGLDARRRETHLRFDPPPSEISAGRAIFEMDLAPGEKKTLFFEASCGKEACSGGLREAFVVGLRDARRALRASVSRAASISTSNEIFNEGVRRSVSDLYMLVTDLPEGSYPYAGIPWFSTVFGRDGLITAMQTLWFDPSIARGVLGHLAANQATTEDAVADAEPGKILHEVRYGEMAELGEVPFRRYYGSVDSTPLFVMLAGDYLERTGDIALISTIWPNIQAALDWILAYGDRDGDGFIEYGRRTAEGLINQGWKDSYDSVFHADGTLARGPIALAEVQAYVYAAWRAGANIARRLGLPESAGEFDGYAQRLRQAFDETFFDEELGTYLLALDGDKRPCRVRTSNAGHALFAGIAFPERAASVVQTLMSGSSFSGWGVRTVDAAEARYNPMSYHNGSVWPHDNATIAAGFARYGFRREAARILEGLFSASIYIDLRRLPELFCGFQRRRSQGPVFYPVACIPQAWAAVSPLSLVQSCLGLGFDPASAQITFNRPFLPEFLDEVVLRGLSVGGGRIDVALRRAGSEVAAHVLAREGDIRVLTTS